MLTPYVPYPPSSGGQIRTFNLLKYLSKRHQITLVALYKNDDEKKYLNHLRRYCRKIYLCRRPQKPWQLSNITKAVFSLLPFLIVRNFSSEAKQVVSNLLIEERFDVIHAETFYIMPHIPITKIPIVLVEQTIEYEVYQHFINSLALPIRLLLSIDILKLKYWERYYWRKASRVATVSAADEQLIQKLEKNIHTSIVPNGAGDEMIVKKLEKKDIKMPIILFQGNFNWLQNIEAAKFLVNDIYPKLKQLLPDVAIVISGQNAHKIQALNQSGIKIVDNPPDDGQFIKTVYLQASIFIAPIFGPGGTRLKILAAMASGLPVIATTTGIEGLAVKNNRDVLIANNSDTFIEKIIYIVKHPAQYQKIRCNAYELVKQKYNWQSITQKLEKLYENQS